MNSLLAASPIARAFSCGLRGRWKFVPGDRFPGERCGVRSFHTRDTWLSKMSWLSVSSAMSLALMASLKSLCLSIFSSSSFGKFLWKISIRFCSFSIASSFGKSSLIKSSCVGTFCSNRRLRGMVCGYEKELTHERKDGSQCFTGRLWPSLLAATLSRISLRSCGFWRYWWCLWGRPSLQKMENVIKVQETERQAFFEVQKYKTTNSLGSAGNGHCVRVCSPWA